MSHALKKTLLMEDEYLAGEALGRVRSEYVAGEVYAMAGGSARHNKISGNLYVRLHTATRGTPCEVFMADMKLRIDAHRAFYYPDVMVSCPRGAEEHPLYRSSPCLVAEVLSPTTANIDEREKWLHYRDIPSLKYFLLIDSERRHARLRIRDADGWLEQTLDAGELVALACEGMNTTLCLDDLYDRTGL